MTAALAIRPETPSSRPDEATLRAGIRERVRVWERCKAELAIAMNIIAKCEKDLSEALGNGSRDFKVADYLSNKTYSYSTADMLSVFELEAWQGIIGEMELSRFLSVSAHEKLNKQLSGEGESMPELTEDNAVAVFSGMLSQIPNFADEALKEVFSFLRPPGSRYKTNTEFEIGKRVVLENYIEGTLYRQPRVSYYDHPRRVLQAIDRVFHLLDGKGYVSSSPQGHLIAAINELKEFGEEGETEYFRFRAYKKGTLHIEFRRLDLLQELNIRGGGKKLKGEHGKSSRPVMRRKPKQAPNMGFFWTPKWLADRMIKAAEITNGNKVLEPSAGTGSIATYIDAEFHGVKLWAFELDHIRCSVLRDALGESVLVRRCDFLDTDHSETFDAVIMNPPFHDSADAWHVLHAFRALKVGGRLVAIMGAGATSKQQHVYKYLRELVASHGGRFDALPENTFEGTGVNAVLLTMTKKEGVNS